jgi:hypothetical protein
MMKYSDKQIADKLAQVEAFEAKYGKNTTTIAWRKWCTDPKYREREQSFRSADNYYSLAKVVYRSQVQRA